MYENDAYKTKPMENLTINNALILVAVCAAKEKAAPDDTQSDDAKRIMTLAQDHPVFLDLFDSIEPCINKFMNMTERTDAANYVSAAAKILKQDYKETAYAWITEILMSDGVLTEKRKNILDKYALLLNIDGNTAQNIHVQVSQKT